MPQSFQSAQKKAIDSGFLDLLGESKKAYTAPKLDAVAESLGYVAAKYTELLAKSLRDKDADSSGKLADSIIALDVEMFGGVYTVDISTLKYASFIDEGVEGWGDSSNAPNSPYQFKTKGVDPKGKMVKSIKAWLLREGKISRNTKKAVSKREAKRQTITDASTRAAITTAFMIKRQGLKPTYFWRDATRQMEELIKAEFAAALKIDIIQNLKK